jgi:hypothetical protein
MIDGLLKEVEEELQGDSTSRCHLQRSEGAGTAEDAQ